MFNSTTCIFVHPNLLCFRSLSFLFHFACYDVTCCPSCYIAHPVNSYHSRLLVPPCMLCCFPMENYHRSLFGVAQCLLHLFYVFFFFLLHEWRIIHGITLLGGTLLRILPKWLATCFEMTPTNEHNLTSNIYSWYDFMILENYLTWNDLNWHCLI